MDTEKIMKQLQEPFHPNDIEWRVGATNTEKTKGIALAYVTNRAIMNRLDEVFGPFGWHNEFREWKVANGKGGQLCGISVKLGDEWITKWDGADDSDHEATKGGLSDAMKRAGYQWGIGRYLYDLENIWVAIEQRGKSYAIKGDPPKLPAFALPEGFTQPSGNRPPSSSTGGVSAPPANSTPPPKQDPPPAAAQGSFAPEVLLELKKAFQDFKGSLDGFEPYIEKQKAKGWDAPKIIAILKSATKK